MALIRGSELVLHVLLTEDGHCHREIGRDLSQLLSPSFEELELK